jgi:hypothetical protein
MQYKTICLQLLQDQFPRLHRNLQTSRNLLTSLDHYATHLKSAHEAWKARLAETHPSADRDQIASEALEMAIEDFRASLPPESEENADGVITLDGAMAYLRRHTPSA